MEKSFGVIVIMLRLLLEITWGMVTIQLVVQMGLNMLNRKVLLFKRLVESKKLAKALLHITNFSANQRLQRRLSHALAKI